MTMHGSVRVQQERDAFEDGAQEMLLFRVQPRAKEHGARVRVVMRLQAAVQVRVSDQPVRAGFAEIGVAFLLKLRESGG